MSSRSVVHRMGPFLFRTGFDFDYSAISDPCFTPFLAPADCMAGSADVRFDVTMLVPQASNSDPSRRPGGAVEPAELEELLGRCHRPARIRGGSQLLPLLLPRGFEASAVLADAPPVALTRAVFERIREAVGGAEDPMRVSVLAHSLIVEIRDFERLSASVFIAPGLSDLLASRAAFYSLRKLFSLFLPSLGSVMIHCAAVSLECGTVLLAAPDSGGKSTAAALAPPGSVIGDDRILAVRSGSAFNAFGTPWNVAGGNPGGGRVAAVLLLRKADGFRLERIHHREAFAFLWRDNLAYFEDLPPRERDSAFETTLSMCRSAGCGILGFSPDRLDWDAVGRFAEAAP